MTEISFIRQFREQPLLLYAAFNAVHVPLQHWKLTMPADELPGLFDLDDDVSESRDQSAAHPEIVRELRGRYDAWDAQLDALRGQSVFLKKSSKVGSER